MEDQGRSLEQKLARWSRILEEISQGFLGHEQGMSSRLNQFLEEFLDEWASEIHQNEVNSFLSRMGFPSLPSFSGINPIDWINGIEVYFDVYPSMNIYQFSLVEELLVGRAKEWAASWSFDGNYDDYWNEFVYALCERFENVDDEKVDELVGCESTGEKHVVVDKDSAVDVVLLVEPKCCNLVESFCEFGKESQVGLLENSVIGCGIKKQEVILEESSLDVDLKSEDRLLGGVQDTLDDLQKNIVLERLNQQLHWITYVENDDLIRIMVFVPGKRIAKEVKIVFQTCFSFSKLNLVKLESGSHSLVEPGQYQFVKCYHRLQDRDHFDVKSKPPDDSKTTKELEQRIQEICVRTEWKLVFRTWDPGDIDVPLEGQTNVELSMCKEPSLSRRFYSQIIGQTTSQGPQVVGLTDEEKKVWTFQSRKLVSICPFALSECDKPGSSGQDIVALTFLSMWSLVLFTHVKWWKCIVGGSLDNASATVKSLVGYMGSVVLVAVNCFAAKSSNDFMKLGSISEALPHTLYVRTDINLTDSLLSRLNKAKVSSGLNDEVFSGDVSSSDLMTSYVHLCWLVYQQWQLVKLMEIAKANVNSSKDTFLPESSNIRKLELIDVAYLYSNLLKIFSEIENKVKDHYKQKIAAEVAYLVLAKFMQKLKFAAEDSIRLLNQQRALAGEYVEVLDKLDKHVEVSVFCKPGEVFSNVVGSPYYVAPEVLRKFYRPQSDVWIAGVILYILLSRVPPLWAETKMGIFRQILQGKIDFQSEPWPSISDSAKDLIKKMLKRRPKKRITAHEVLCHPWVVHDRIAPDKPLDSAILSRLKQFPAMNKLKKMALRIIAERLSEEEIGGFKELFKMIDTDGSGTITFEELKDGLTRLGYQLKSIHHYRKVLDAASTSLEEAVVRRARFYDFDVP